jgi:hypothetical protein
VTEIATIRFGTSAPGIAVLGISARRTGVRGIGGLAIGVRGTAVVSFSGCSS